MTNAGPMRETIALQVRSETQESNGEKKLLWSTFATRRAEKVSTAGAEQVVADQRVARVPTVFRIRYPREFELTPKNRVVHRVRGRERVFDIKSVDDRDGRRVDLFLTCEELVGEAP